MATNQAYKEYRVNDLPTSGLVAGDRYYLNVGGDKYQTYIVSDTVQLVKESGAEFIEKDTMAQFRAITTKEIESIQKGYYKGVRLNGYYTKGDTPAPINYNVSGTPEADDGGGVIKVSGIKFEHKFAGSPDLRYFGAIYNDSSKTIENATAIVKALKYSSTIIVDEDLRLGTEIDLTDYSSINFIGTSKKSCITPTIPVNGLFKVKDVLDGISFSNIRISTNATKVYIINKRDTHFYCNLFQIYNCDFYGNLSFFFEAFDNFTSIKSTFKKYTFNNNSIRNNKLNFCFVQGVAWDEMFITNNNISNLNEVGFYLATGDADDILIRKERKYLEVSNNTVINDRDSYKTDLIQGVYNCLVIAQAGSVIYKNNVVNGLKSIVACGVYDAYLDCTEVLYTDNVNINNLCLVENDLNCFLKLKAGSNAVCQKNIFKTDSSFLDRVVEDYPTLNRDHFTMRHYSASTLPESPCNLIYSNNQIDTYYLDNTLAQNYSMENVIISNNNVNCDYYKGTFLTIYNRVASSEKRKAELSNNNINIKIGDRYSTPFVSGVESLDPNYESNIDVIISGNTIYNLYNSIVSSPKISTLIIENNKITSIQKPLYWLAFTEVNRLFGTNNTLELSSTSQLGVDFIANKINETSFEETRLFYNLAENNSSYGFTIPTDGGDSSMSRVFEAQSKTAKTKADVFMTYNSETFSYKNYITDTDVNIDTTIVPLRLGNGSTYEEIFNSNGLILFLRVIDNLYIDLGYLVEPNSKIKIITDVR